MNTENTDEVPQKYIAIYSSSKYKTRPLQVQKLCSVYACPKKTTI